MVSTALLAAVATKLVDLTHQRSLPATLMPERAREVAAQMNRRIDTYTGR